jgi:hypothetical protein
MFTDELEQLVNRYSIENESDTPDFILAKYIRNCLDTWNAAVKSRDQWYGFNTFHSEYSQSESTIKNTVLVNTDTKPGRDFLASAIASEHITIPNRRSE